MCDSILDVEFTYLFISGWLDGIYCNVSDFLLRFDLFCGSSCCDLRCREHSSKRKKKRRGCKTGALFILNSN